MRSDGNERTQTYTTVSKRLADDVQRLAFWCGKAAIVREVSGGFVDKAYNIRVCDVQVQPKSLPKTHKEQEYDGFVYDVTVPNHVFLMRRDGKVSWTGNCWEGYAVLEISNTTPLPAKVYADEGIAQVLFFKGEPCLVSYADRKGRYQNQKDIVTAKV